MGNRPLGINLRDLTNKKFGRLKVIERDLEKRNNTYWICRCIYGNITSVMRSKLLNGNTKSCGCLNRELASKRMRINNPIKKMIHPLLGKKGKLSPNYGRRKINPKSPISLLIRMSSAYELWRNEVFERDNYIYQKCSKHKPVLNSHHIESFNNNKDGRFDLRNGITLCQECHMYFHKRFGFGYNSKKQLEKFLYEKLLHSV